MCPLLRLQGEIRRSIYVKNAAMEQYAASVGAKLPNHYHEDIAIGVYLAWARN